MVSCGKATDEGRLTYFLNGGTFPSCTELGNTESSGWTWDLGGVGAGIVGFLGVTWLQFLGFAASTFWDCTLGSSMKTSSRFESNLMDFKSSAMLTEIKSKPKIQVLILVLDLHLWLDAYSRVLWHEAYIYLYFVHSLQFCIKLLLQKELKRMLNHKHWNIFS